MKTKLNSKKNTKWIFVPLLSTFITSFTGSALNLSIPSIAAEFGSSAAQSSWIVTAYMLACTALPVPLGKLAENVSGKKILAIGLALFTASSIGGSLSSQLAWLLMFRLGQGIGTAMIYSTSMSVLVSSAADGARNQMLGYSTAATCLGLSAGPAAGGILSQYLGWRWIFAATAGISAVAFSGALHSLKETSERTAKCNLPYGSGILYIGSVSFLISGLSLASAYIWGWGLAGTGTVGLAIYVYREKKAVNPLIRREWLGDKKELPILSLLAAINFGTVFVLNYQLSIYLQICRGFSPQKAGLILVFAPAVQSAVSFITGKLAGRQVSLASLQRTGMVGTGAAAAGFALLQLDTPLWMFCAGLVCSGFFSALFASPNASLLFAAAGKEQSAMASSMVSTMRSMGHSLCMAVGSVTAGFYLGGAKLQEAQPQQMLQVMETTFFLLSGLCIIGFIMALSKKM